MIKENPKTTIFIASIIYGLGLICHLGFNILIFRQFSLEEVGTYGLTMSIAVFAGFVMDMGISQTLIRGFSQNTLSFSQAVVGSLTLRIPLLAIGLGTLAGWLWFKPSLGPMEVALLALAIVAQSLIGLRVIATSWLRAHVRQNVANAINLLGPLGYVVVGFLLLYFHKLNLLLFFFGILLIEGMVTTLAFSVTNKIKLPFHIKEFISLPAIKDAAASLWKPSLIFGTITLCEVVQNRLDWILVYAYTSKTELAYYSLANKVFELFDYGVVLLVQTTLPWMCKMNLTGDKDIGVIISFKAIAFFGMVMAAALALCMPGFLTMFWGAKFEKANNLIFLFMSGACLAPVYTMLYYLLISAGKERFLLVSCIVPVLFQLAANLILIPHYGAFGATIGMLVFFLTTFIFISIFSIKNHLSKFAALPRFIIILLITILTLYFYKSYLPQTYLANFIFILVITFLGLMILLTRSEWALILRDLNIRKVL